VDDVLSLHAALPICIADFTSAYDVSRKCDEKTMKRLDGRTVSNAVDTLGPEMPLERFHDEFRRLVEQAVDFQAVPIDRQHRLQRDRKSTRLNSSHVK